MSARHRDPVRASRWRPRWGNVALLGIGVALVVIFARHIDWTSTMRALRRADLRLVALAVSFDLASIVVKGARWGLLLRAVGARGMAPAIRDTIVGAALNNMVVANGGDAARVAITAQRARISSANVVAALAVERFTDAAAYVTLFGMLALGVALPGPFARWSVAAITAFAVTVVVCALLVSRRRSVLPAWERTRGQTRPLAALDRRTARASIAAVSRYARQLRRVIASVAGGRYLAIALGMSLLVWAGQWATFYVAARAAAVPISASLSLLALLAVNASFVVRLTPGNLGVFQLFYVLAATAAGLDRHRALAAALLIQLVQYIPVTCIGLVFAPAVARAGLSRRRLPVSTPNRGTDIENG